MGVPVNWIFLELSCINGIQVWFVESTNVSIFLKLKLDKIVKIAKIIISRYTMTPIQFRLYWFEHFVLFFKC